jgi:hypothetical protein
MEDELRQFWQKVEAHLTTPVRGRLLTYGSISDKLLLELHDRVGEYLDGQESTDQSGEAR